MPQSHSLNHLIGPLSSQSRRSLLSLAALSQVGGNCPENAFPCLSYVKRREEAKDCPETQTE